VVYHPATTTNSIAHTLRITLSRLLAG
jgi:hypothetical protein